MLFTAMYVLSKPKWAAVVCLAGFLFNFLIYYPGFLSPDSVDQYQQALTHTYGDWHPPVMAYLWHWLNYISKGPQGMLAFQLALLWSSCFLLLISMPGRRWSIAVLLLVLAPFVQNFSGYIVKDTQMAFAFLLVFALLFARRKTVYCKGFAWNVLIILLLCYSTWLRINALPAMLPLAILFVWETTGGKTNVRLFHTCILLLFILVFQWLFTFYVIRPEKDHPEDKLFLHDITAIYATTCDSRYPAFMYRQPGFDSAYIRTHYEPATFDKIWGNKDGITILTDENEDSVRALQQAWIGAIKAHPLAYLHHRTMGFLYYLRILNSGSNCCAVYLHSDPNVYGIIYTPGPVASVVVKLIVAQQNMWYMRPWFWLMLTVVLLFFAHRRKNDPEQRHMQVLLLSGLLYQLPYFFIAPADTDFRYCYWTCIACGMAVVLMIAPKTGKSAAMAV